LEVAIAGVFADNEKKMKDGDRLAL